MTAEQWGRVDGDGTVWVRTADGERAVGQYPGASQEEALAYFTRKFEDLRAQVDLLEQRVKAGQVSPADAEAGIVRQREAITDAHAVGDLDGLLARLESLAPLVKERRAEAERVRRQAREQAITARTALVEEAEQIASSTESEHVQWKASGDRLRELFDQWRTAQKESRLDRHTDDALWERFRAAQDAFFAARSAQAAEADSEFRQNLEVKERLLAEAEGLLPVTDVAAARSALRSIQERWESAGKVPRGDLARTEAGLRRVEQAVRDAEQERWTRTNPEARARAADVVSQLENTIAGLQRDLAAAQARSDQRAIRDVEQALQAREQWLAQARQALAEFGG